MSDLTESFKYRIYNAAKDGMSRVMYVLLRERTPDEITEILNEYFYEEDGQKCTPLIVAARHGRREVVEVFLSKFEVDLEKEGTAKFDGYVIEGASALWCAAGAGYLNIVKALVRAGADVNHPTKSNSTPIRAACFEGSLDVVKYLAAHNADINLANKFNNTCLMIAAYKGHIDVVTFLLKNHAKVDEKALCGATALHFAAESGHVNVVIELLDYGASLTKNNIGVTPLIAAAERTRVNVVEYITKVVPMSIEDQIDAFELLGASFANDKENYCIELAFGYLRRGMMLRYKDGVLVYRKSTIPPIPAYLNRIECQTLEDLDAIQYNHFEIHMESLTIRERILGPDNPEIPHQIIFRGAVFADNAQFQNCIDLWLRALNLRQTNGVSVVKDLLRFAQLFAQMQYINENLNPEHIITILKATVLELERNKEKLANPGSKDDPDVITEEMESNIKTALYLVTMFTKISKKTTENLEMDDENFQIKKLVYALNRMDLRLKDQKTMLHLAVSPDPFVDEFHINDVCKFPCAATVELLISIGADVNAMDWNRNTPLHLIVTYKQPITDFLTLHSIIIDLTEAGAHMDTVNALGETPTEASTTYVAEIILRAQMRLSLQCLSARVIKKYEVPYLGLVPPGLCSFIELHGTGVEKKHVET